MRLLQNCPRRRALRLTSFLPRSSGAAPPRPVAGGADDLSFCGFARPLPRRSETHCLFPPLGFIQVPNF
uniref:Uncharacterized protein n=1 Tax=Oryza rufipogon TaxID=4529 RepID=A0A0E0PE63_ORYRU